MPEKKTTERARKKKREGKAPTTQAGEFVREEIEHVREGKHGARSAKQAIAIGLSKARRAGIDVPPKGKAAKKKLKSSANGRKKFTRKKAGKKKSSVSAQVATRASKREGRQAVTHRALSRQAKQAARKRGNAAKRKGKKSARKKGDNARSGLSGSN